MEVGNFCIASYKQWNIVGCQKICGRAGVELKQASSDANTNKIKLKFWYLSIINIVFVILYTIAVGIQT